MRGLALLLFSFFAMHELSATHLRGGTLTWQPTTNPNEVEFRLVVAFDPDGVGVPSVFAVGSVVSGSYLKLHFGDGIYENISLVVTSINSADGYYVTEATVTHTYSAPGNFNAHFRLVYRIPGIQNIVESNNRVFRLETTVNVGAGNSPPVSTFRPFIKLSVDLVDATFLIPFVDPDGDPVAIRPATNPECTESSNIYYVLPSGLTIDQSGFGTFNTTGLTVGDLYSVILALEDLDAAGNVISKTMTDFFIQIVEPSSPPTFIAPTPPAGQTYVVAPGQPLSVSFAADDPNLPGTTGGDVVLSATGVPLGSVFGPSNPTTPGNPVSATFTWTPLPTDVGSYVMLIAATDGAGGQVTTSITINVSTEPVFSVPGPYNLICLEPGDPLSQVFTAADVNPLESILLTASLGAIPPPTVPTPPLTPGGGFPFQTTFPASLSFSPGLPTSANPVSTTYTGIVTAADWGIYPLQLVAEDQENKTDEVDYFLSINQPPAFTSAAPVSPVIAQVGIPFSLTFSGSDPDAAYGDAVGFADAAKPYVSIPSWATLTDNGDGTATLSGTPGVANAGTTTAIQIELHDRITHFQHQHCGWQFQNFSIEVCDPTLINCAAGNFSFGTSEDGVIAPANCVFTNDQAGATFIPEVSIVDNCPDYTIRYDLTGATVLADLSSLNAISFEPGTTTVTVSARDMTGATMATTCAFDVIITDDEVPTINCNPTTVQLDNLGMGSITVNDISNGAMDNCGVASVTASSLSFGCGDLGTNTVTVTVTDVNGNTSNCSTPVNVVENPAPPAAVGPLLWTGSASGEWQNPCNWQPYGVPAAQAAVNVPGGTPHGPVLTASQTYAVQSLTLQTQGSLTVPAGSSLTVGGTLLIDAAALTNEGILTPGSTSLQNGGTLTNRGRVE